MDRTVTCRRSGGRRSCNRRPAEAVAAHLLRLRAGDYRAVMLRGARGASLLGMNLLQVALDPVRRLLRSGSAPTCFVCHWPVLPLGPAAEVPWRHRGAPKLRDLQDARASLYGLPTRVPPLSGGPPAPPRCFRRAGGRGVRDAIANPVARAGSAGARRGRRGWRGGSGRATGSRSRCTRSARP